MKVSSEQAPDSQVVLTIEIEPAELEKSLESAYRRLGNRAVVPGFRKGKAPRQVLERFFGRSAVMEDAIEHLAPDVIQEAIEEQKIEAISQARLEVTQLEPVILKATVDVKPTIELGDYNALRVDVVQPELADDAVDKTLENLREREATWEPVERAVEADDIVTAEYEITEGDEIVGKSTGTEYRVMLDRKDPLPGFAEQLVGVEPGASKEFELAFPEDHDESDLAGKTFNVTASVKEVKGKQLPALDEAFVGTVTNDLTTVEELRARIERNLKAQSELDAYNKTREAALQALADSADVDTPFSLIENEVDTSMRERRSLISGTGLRWEDYVQIIGGSEEAMREKSREDARERVRRRLLLEALAEAEGIEASIDEVNDELADEIRTSGLSAAQAKTVLDHPQAREISERNIRTRKALVRLVEIATEGKAKPPQDSVDETLIDSDDDDSAITEEGS